MSTFNLAAVTAAYKQLIDAIGEDPARAGLLDTPERCARFWQEFMTYKDTNFERTFEAVQADQMVAVCGIRVHSLCEHHLLPFWADISIGYITNDKVLGLSKFARIAQRHAHALQLQERLVQQIACDVMRVTESESVAVFARGVHSCMVMRGIKSDGVMVTSVMHGAFREDAQTRAEFLHLVGMGLDKQ